MKYFLSIVCAIALNAANEENVNHEDGLPLTASWVVVGDPNATLMSPPADEKFVPEDYFLSSESAIDKSTLAMEYYKNKWWVLSPLLEAKSVSLSMIWSRPLIASVNTIHSHCGWNHKMHTPLVDFFRAFPSQEHLNIGLNTLNQLLNRLDEKSSLKDNLTKNMLSIVKTMENQYSDSVIGQPISWYNRLKIWLHGDREQLLRITWHLENTKIMVEKVIANHQLDKVCIFFDFLRLYDFYNLLPAEKNYFQAFLKLNQAQQVQLLSFMKDQERESFANVEDFLKEVESHGTDEEIANKLNSLTLKHSDLDDLD